MTFAELVEPLQASERQGNLDVAVTSLTDDSRAVKPGSVFVAVKGERVDGHAFVGKAVGAGAAALVLQKGQSVTAAPSIPVVRVDDSRRVLGVLAGRFYREPASRLCMVGVTGTNGKTTVTYLCKGVLETAGRRVGLIGTVAYQIGEERLPSAHTTPGAVELQALLARMVEAGMNAAVMEVSSHALAMDRTTGCEFDVAIFTNLTQDHLDFHRDMDGYFQAKLRLFADLDPAGRKLRPKRAIVNIDDARGARVCGASRVPVWTYAIQKPADIRAEDVRLALSGTRFTAATPHGRFPVESRLVGEHNVYNILAAIGVGLHEGLSPEIIQRGIASVVNVPGRFERVEAGQDFTVVVDYAHTDDALLRLLTAAQALKTGRVITVFGCGGDRDRGKRPKMGHVAARLSDVVFLTSDNPRSEDPAAILREIEVGVREALADRRIRYEVIADRRAAIEAAVREAKSGDTVLIAGKGHEDYQIVGSTRLHFDDREVARAALAARRA
ncbi:MAG: UDP-N-acetylmuramoyl-L-alanyl-D-glutamate--2,6-diaminopimelate ligase [Nitrospiraceae bacterium]|nr:UDP-N-acetylmuramoyl-L-alanyl-D-glutamate--2,6-diaminopimelate ligase [Nitrospiraceae bacterium]MSR23924.1 UDP-N-acetylmuramoyl-L-alanyl-D-glutamate--2,6-diaminopimelate ligase [Nitrospiraceae bacterium]